MRFGRRKIRKAFATSGMRRRRVAGEMNRTETRFRDEVVLPLVASGTVVGWWFEEWTFKLGPDLRYTPDFVLLFSDGSLEVREVKARDRRTGKYRAEDDAKVKMKAFAETMPLAMVVAFPGATKGTWETICLSPPTDD